jgi:hypothetical protein
MKKKELVKWLTVALAAVGVLTQAAVLPPVVGQLAAALGGVLLGAPPAA